MIKKKENRPNRNRTSLVLLAAVCMMMAVLAGCNETVEESSISSGSEVVSEVVAEPVSEEVSEPVSEEISEVVSEEVVEELDLSLYTTENGKKVVDLVNDMPYDELKVIVWRKDSGAEAILSDGDSYQLEDADDNLYLYYSNQVQEIKSNTPHIKLNVRGENVCGFNVFVKGEDLEVSFTVVYEDGTEEDITIYITKDFEH